MADLSFKPTIRVCLGAIAWDEAAERARFEAWIGGPPYEKRLIRLGPENSWPGHYADINVQLAWEAWEERGNLKACPSCGLPHPTGEDCGLTFDGLPNPRPNHENAVTDGRSAEPGVRSDLPGGL